MDLNLIFEPAAMSALLKVLMIDLVLAGDNAVAVGLAAAGLSAALRKKAILLGLLVAVVLRIGFALVTTQLLAIVGLLSHLDFVCTCRYRPLWLVGGSASLAGSPTAFSIA